MPQDKAEDEGLAFDDEYAPKLKVARTVENARRASPRKVFGEAFLRSATHFLQTRNQSNQPVTCRRLAIALRGYTRSARIFLEATQAPRPDYEVEPSVVAEDQPSPHLPANAKTKRDAERKLKQAKRALQKVLEYLNSEEVSVFAKLEPRATDSLFEEIGRIALELIVPLGQRRGLPAVSMLVTSLHRELHRLTGSWLRGSRSDRNDDEEISNLLYDLARPLIPSSVHDEALRMIIETSIKKRH